MVKSFDMLNRRKLLKQFMFAGAGIMLVPSCLSDKSKSSILLKKISISNDDEHLLAELCETILPKTNTPGAKDISAHLFVLKMVDDCMAKTDQDSFIKGMEAFHGFAKENIGKKFSDANPEERKKVMEKILTMKEEKTDLISFFKTVKRYTIQAYTGSEFYLTKIQVYQLVPGKFHGCVPA